MIATRIDIGAIKSGRCRRASINKIGIADSPFPVPLFLASSSRVRMPSFRMPDTYIYARIFRRVHAAFYPAVVIYPSHRDRTVVVDIKPEANYVLRYKSAGHTHSRRRQVIIGGAI